MSTPRIVELSDTIHSSIEAIRDFLRAGDVPFPSFDADAPTAFPERISAYRDAVLDATAELHDLLLEPLNLLYRHGAHNNMVSLQAINRFDIARSVPLDGQISFPQLAESIGMKEKPLRCLLRHAMTMRIFSEPHKGMVAHTSVSKMLMQPHVHDWMNIGSEEMWPAAVRVNDALSKWPNSEEPNETGFSLANNTQESIYQVIGSDAARASRFAHAMDAFTADQSYNVSYIVDHYDWNALGSALVVDVGGAQGHVGIRLAQRYPSLNILIQDMEKVIDSASLEPSIAELAPRVRFMAHDFFSEQPVEADVYYFRWIFHNWSDKYSIQILRCLTPALKHGARIVINDTCMPEPGRMAQWREKDLRSADLNMLGIFNSRERDADEWRWLFEEADARFEFLGVTEPSGSALAIIEARWTGERPE